MIRINYPELKPQIRNGIKEEIFCINRKKWVLLTPEEWVRQNLLLYLIHKVGYPKSLIAVERQIKVGDLSKRFDIVCYKNNEPFIVIECKKMSVSLTDDVLMQVLRYNMKVNAKYLIITNGLDCFGFEKEENRLKEIEVFPDYAERD